MSLENLEFMHFTKGFTQPPTIVSKWSSSVASPEWIFPDEIRKKQGRLYEMRFENSWGVNKRSQVNRISRENLQAEYPP